MKKFRIRNLTVAIDSPKDKLRACGPFWSCPGGGGIISMDIDTIRTICPGACSLIISQIPTGPGGCGLNYSTCNFSEFRTTDMVTNVVRIEDNALRAQAAAHLKADLKEAVEALKSQEKAIRADAMPQSLKEANELEATLKNALKDVAAAKKKLKK